MPCWLPVTDGTLSNKLKLLSVVERRRSQSFVCYFQNMLSPRSPDNFINLPCLPLPGKNPAGAHVRMS